MNMRAIFLHALGDALGNVGVIVTGLLIWLVPTVDRHGNDGKNGWIVYADPTISLVITGIIFTSALPLGKLYLTFFC
jgi:zinc transporter 1